MVVNQDDFLIIEQGKKHRLTKVLKNKNNKIIVKYADVPQSENFSLPEDLIIANLGKNPKYGSAYNLKIEPFREHHLLRPVGDVFVFRFLEDEERESLLKQLKIFAKWVEREGFITFLPIVINIRNKRGKWAGSYKYTTKEDTLDELTIHTENLVDLQYLFKHEWGHHVWFRYLNDKQRAKWVSLFKEKILTIHNFDDKMLKKLKNDWIKSKLTGKEFIKECEDVEKKLFVNAISYVKRSHKLNLKHVDLMLHEGKEITKYWPQEITFCEPTSIVSEYACVSPEEFFAESFAFYYLKESNLDSEISTSMEKTLKNLKSRGL
jgi:hypothetical protein